MSDPAPGPWQLPSRALTLGLLVALPLFVGRMYLWASLAASGTVAVCLLLALAGALLSRDRGEAGGLRSGAADVLLAAFLVCLALASIKSVYLHGSLVAVLQIGAYLAMMLLCAAQFREDRWRRAGWWAIALGGILASLLGLREYAHTAILQGARTWRIFGTFYNPNCLAGYLIVTIPAAVVLLAFAWRRTLHPGSAERSAGPGQERHERPRVGLILVGFAVALPIAALFLTASRAGALGAMLGAVVFAVVGPKRIRGRWLALALLALAVVVVVAPPLRNRVVEFTAQSHSAIFRWYTWGGAVEMIRARPLLGFGPGTFEFAYQGFAQAGFTRMAHQTSLQVAAEAGLPALAALLAGLALLARELLAAARTGGPRGMEAVAGLAALAALGLQNLLDYTWYVPAVGLSLAAVVGLARAAAQSSAVAKVSPFAEASGDRMADKSEEPPAQALRPASRAQTWVGIVACIIVLAACGRGLQAQILAARGRALLGQGRHELAVGWLQQAGRTDPLDAAIFEDTAKAAANSGTLYGFRRAVAARLRATELCPLKADNFLALAHLYEALGEYTSALAAARRAVELGPNYPRAYVALAQLLERTGNHNEAIATYRSLEEVHESPVGKYQAVEQVTDYFYAYAWLALGREAMDAGEFERAAQYLHRASALAGEYARYQRSREERLRLIGMWYEADVVEAERLQAEAELAGRSAERKRQERAQP